ncbi:hypothetical protein K9L67_00180 [Candidatus Woesearchaeota archaeon]|nr:hypothetical protein [Candidatus Woesearchaeota archaeon]
MILKKFEIPKQNKQEKTKLQNSEITDLDRLDYTLKKIEDKLAKLEN